MKVRQLILRSGTLEKGALGRIAFVRNTGALQALGGATAVAISVDQGYPTGGLVLSVAAMLSGLAMVVWPAAVPFQIAAAALLAALVVPPIGIAMFDHSAIGPTSAFKGIATILWVSSFTQRRWAIAYATSMTATTGSALIWFAPTPSLVLGAYFAAGCVAATLLMMWVVDEFERQTFLDPLTRVGNRRRWQALVPRVFEGLDQPFSLISVDIDRFKELNDRLGHAAGDAALVQVAAEIRRHAGSTGEVIRWGGDEFVIALPGVSVQHAHATADRLRTAVGARYSISISMGVCTRTDGESLPALLHRADTALYVDKAGSRTRAIAMARTITHQQQPPLERTPEPAFDAGPAPLPRAAVPRVRQTT